MKKLYLGTSGFNYRDWKGRFYPASLPQREWLSFFASKYSTVEINNSFYTSVRKETYERWYSLAPDDFTFVLKGHRYITQYKKLLGVEEAVEQFFAAALGLDEKLTAVLWQFPKSFSAEQNYSRLGDFLKLLPLSIRHAFEFRDTSWFTPEVNSLLQSYNASMVISQSGVFPEIEMVNKNFVYIRFHGPTSLYTSGYSDEELRKWAEKIRRYLINHDVYVYFNNDAGGKALDNLETLKGFLKV